MVNILGIRLSGLNRKQTLEKISSWLKGEGAHYVVTPNPEIILRATLDQDEELFHILNHADLSLADGMGLVCAALLKGHFLPRYTGADFLQDLLALAEKTGQTVLFLLWEKGLSSPADLEKIIKEKYPLLQFQTKVMRREESYQDNNTQGLSGNIVLAALGAPYQEKFIFHHLKSIADLKVAVGIGGGLDFLTKKVRRAPKLWRSLGLEWAFRPLVEQPGSRIWRLKRIYRAVIIFPRQIIRYHFILPFRYRPNVACILYKKENNQYRILILEREDAPGHWQLPQGGTEGLALKVAAAKELREELNNDRFEVRKTFPGLYKYRFDSGMGKYPVQRNEGYRGQRQGLAIAEFLGRDEDIKPNYWDHRNWKWVDANDLPLEVHPLRKPSAEIFLKKFKENI